MCCVYFPFDAPNNTVYSGLSIKESQIMPYLMSVSSAMYCDNNEQRVYFTRCNANLTGCGWEEAESYSDPADCDVTECPDCGSDSVVDESEYV